MAHLKQCTGPCRLWKWSTTYHPQQGSPDGRATRCNRCHYLAGKARVGASATGKLQRTATQRRYKQTPRGFVAQLWANINCRTVNGKTPAWEHKHHRRYLLQGVQLKITRDDLLMLVCDKWVEIKHLIETHQHPSLDRIDSLGHYETGNLRFISKRDNCSRSRRKRDQQ